MSTYKTIKKSVVEYAQDRCAKKTGVISAEVYGIEIYHDVSISYIHSIKKDSPKSFDIFC